MPTRGAEVAGLIEHVRKAGFEVIKNGSSHYKVLREDGAVVADDRGPVTISSTPSDRHWRDSAVKQLLRAGVLSFDPYKPSGHARSEPAEPGKKLKPLSNPVQSARIHAAKIVALKKKSDAQAEATAKQRSRLEPVINHIGGWGVRGTRTLQEGEPLSSRTQATISEIGDVIHHWARMRGRVELPKDPQTNTHLEPRFVVTAVGTLKAGNTLGGKWLPLITVFLDDLWRDAGHDPKKAAARYFELLREAKGIVETTSPRPLAPVPLMPSLMPSAWRQVDEMLGAEETPETPVSALALETMFWLAKSPIPYDRAMEITAEIARCGKT